MKTVDAVKKKMDAISEEIEGIEKAQTTLHILYTYALCCMQGFLQAELVEEACRGLHKKCVAVSEQLMQSMESLDGIVRQSTVSLLTHATPLQSVQCLCAHVYTIPVLCTHRDIERLLDSC